MSGINGNESDSSDDSTGAVAGLSDVISSSVSSLPAIMAAQGKMASTSAVKTPLGTVATTGALSSGSLWLVVVLVLLMIGAIFLVVRKRG